MDVSRDEKTVGFDSVLDRVANVRYALYTCPHTPIYVSYTGIILRLYRAGGKGTSWTVTLNRLYEGSVKALLRLY